MKEIFLLFALSAIMVSLSLQKPLIYDLMIQNEDLEKEIRGFIDQYDDSLIGEYDRDYFLPENRRKLPSVSRRMGKRVLENKRSRKLKFNPQSRYAD